MNYLYNLVRFTRQFRIFFCGLQERREDFYICHIPIPVDIKPLYDTLARNCHQYNYMSTTYRKQVFTTRKVLDADYQIHLRFYCDGVVTGHYELQPEEDVISHCRGIECRPLNDVEKEEVILILSSAL